MSIPSLLQALAQGYSSKQIVDWLKNNHKKIGKNIKSALSQGYSDDQILTYLTKGKHASHGERNQMLSGMTEQEKSSRILNRPTDLSKVGPAIGIAGGIYGTAKALPALQRGVQGFSNLLGGATNQATPVPSPTPPTQGPIGPAPMANAPVHTAPIPQTPPANPAIAAAATQPPPIAQPINSLPILEQMGLKPRIDNLRQAGNAPEAITAGIESTLSPGQKKWLGEQIKEGKAKPINQMVSDYLQSAPTNELPKPTESVAKNRKIPKSDLPTEASESSVFGNDLAKEWESIEKETHKPRPPERPDNADFWEKHISKDTKNPPKSTKDKIRKVNSEIKRIETRFKGGKHYSDEAIETFNDINHYKDYLKKLDEHETDNKPKKGSLVATPDGIVGDIKDIKEKEALVQGHNGKLHKAKVEDLIHSPLPEKDLADLFDEVVGGIEKETEEEVSRNVNWAGYDPKTNTLAYLPYLGSFYTYENIDPEEAKLLTSILNVRKTSGENFIGAWKENSKSPIGAAMSALIKKLQAEAGGKGKEYSHKFETLYNALEPAMKASKKKKLEEEKRKRKEKK